MLNMMATDESVGYYSYAQKTVNMVLTMANAVTAALLPRLSYYYENDREGFYRLLDKGFQILCLMTLPLAVGMALVAEQTVQFLYGEAFAPAALTIQLMCPLILIKGFGDLFCYQLVYSTKSEKNYSSGSCICIHNQYHYKCSIDSITFTKWCSCGICYQ